MARDIRTAVNHSQRTLDGLLTLARSQTGPSRRAMVDLADLAGEVAASATQRAAEQQVELRTNALPAPIAGDPTLLDRMIVNLVDNAIRYNQPGGHVTTTTGNADAIVSAHDGDISCLARPGGGLDISIRFSTPLPARAGEET